MNQSVRRLRYLLGAASLTAALCAALPGGASATTTQTCSGTFSSPGVLTGYHAGNVNIEGVCVVNAGPAEVHGTLTLLHGSALAAIFGQGGSRLTVDGNVNVLNGATLFLGCLPSSFPCKDDPNPNAPTLSSAGKVGGSITVHDALGVIVHNSSIKGSVTQTYGGGAFSCAPSGVFAQIGSPVYSDYEDSTVGGSLNIRHVVSCWLGVARVNIGGSAHFRDNRMADRDAVEIIGNTITGNLECYGNSMVWDSFDISPIGELFPRQADPNTVMGSRMGQCVLSSPMSPGGPLGPGPF